MLLGAKRSRDGDCGSATKAAPATRHSVTALFSESNGKFITTFHHFGKEKGKKGKNLHRTTHSKHVLPHLFACFFLRLLLFLLLFRYKMPSFAYARNQRSASALKTKERRRGREVNSLPRLNLRKQRNLFSKQYQSNENPNDLTWKFPPRPPAVDTDVSWQIFLFACLLNLFLVSKDYALTATKVVEWKALSTIEIINCDSC